MSVPLLLDEMFAPLIARALRERGHDVLAVVDTPTLRAMSDDEVFSWAADHGRRVVTENVKDFRRLLRRYEESGARAAALLLTSHLTFPRSRRNPGPLIDALDAFGCAGQTTTGRRTKTGCTTHAERLTPRAAHMIDTGSLPDDRAIDRKAD